jgi:phenylacetate-CoA ligase
VLAEPAWARRLPGVRAEDIARVEDWRKLPFLTKEELRDAYPYGLACARETGYRRIQMSSGTTGNPILNPYTASDVAQWGEVMARCYVAAGVGRTDVIQITPSFGLFTGGFGFHYGAERLGAMVIPTGAGRTGLQLRLMRDLKATVITAIATYPLRLIEAAHEDAFDLASLSLKVGILGSEMWSDELRTRIERELAIRTFDIIGMTESGGPGLGTDCAARAGVHVWEDHYHPEIVDPATGAVVPDGAEGELVIYKGINFYPRQIEMTLLRHAGVSHEYQIVLDTDGGGERMTIHVETDPGCEPAVAARIKRELHDALALSPEVRLCTPGSIERAQGKAVRVVDRRPRQ